LSFSCVLPSARKISLRDALNSFRLFMTFS
jgi:hypothetical protein